MTKKRTGLNTLAYMGVEASSPPNLTMYVRAPTTKDYDEFNIGHLWIHDTTPQEVWMLTNKDAQIATWILLNDGGGGNIVRVDGGDNINTVNPTGPTVTVNLNKSIYQPVTNVAGDEGGYFLGGNTFLHGRGTQNTFVGESAGNLNLVEANARRNTGIGYHSLTSNLDGENNVAAGNSSLSSLVNGDRNTSLGSGNLVIATDVDFNTSVGADGLGTLLTGDYNTTLGYQSGVNYTAGESSNILIGNKGVAAENNTIRIGVDGVGDGEQDTCYIAGIYQSIIGGTNEIVFIDDDGQLGSYAGDDGEVLIGATGGAPIWARIHSSDGSIIVNSGANSIDLTIGGAPGGGATTFITDVGGPAVVNGNVITMAGDGIIQTDGSVAHTVTFEFVDGTNGQLLIAGGGGGPAWGNLASAGGTINITYPGANQINLEAVGAGGATTFVTDSGTANTVAGTINVLGGDNINTAGAGQTVTVHLNKSIIQPDTNAAGTEGLYALGSGTTFMHNYGAAGTSYNTFLGEDAGNLTHTASVDCTGIGYQALNSSTTGVGNTCIASGSGKDITTGSNNTSLGLDSLFQVNAGNNNVALGKHALNGIVTGSDNLALGTGAGSSCTATDSDNILLSHVGSAGLNNTIRIGTQGVGSGQQNTTFVAGIHGVTPAGATQTVIIDANGQLGSTATVVSAILQVDGGANIHTVNPNGPTVEVHLNDAVYLPATNAAATSGVYDIDGTHLHAYGTGNVFLGKLAGNLTFATATVVENVGIGTGSLNSLAANSSYNVSLGTSSLNALANGNSNVSLGYQSMEWATNSSNNVSAGKDALGQLLTGSNNVALGFEAGVNYTSNESSNILIGNDGTVTDNNVIRIGTEGTGTGEQDTTYVAGIWDKDLGGAASRQVHITATGLLGTEGLGEPAFLGIQALTAANVTGDNTIYTAGTTTQVNEIYDVTNDYDPGGGGNPATFTAPVDGLYFLEVQFLVEGLVAPPPPPPPPVLPCGDPAIVTSNRTYNLINSVFEYQANGQQSYFYNAVCDMDAADTATFYIQVLFGDGTRILDIGANQTFISGYLIRLL